MFSRFTSTTLSCFMINCILPNSGVYKNYVLYLFSKWTQSYDICGFKWRFHLFIYEWLRHSNSGTIKHLQNKFQSVIHLIKSISKKDLHEENMHQSRIRFAKEELITSKMQGFKDKNVCICLTRPILLANFFILKHR